MSEQPGGKPSAVVYRRRRLVALVLLIVLIVLVILGVRALVGAFSARPAATTAAQATAQPSPSASPTPSAAASATPTPTPTSTTPAVCSANEVQVTAIMDAATYAAGVRPKMAMKLVNVSANPCRMDVGTAAQVYTVKSGSDTIWVSTHCQQNPTSQVVELLPGKEVSSPALEWVRERSAPNTCDANSRPAAVAGGAYYSLTVSIGGISSEPLFFVLQ